MEKRISPLGYRTVLRGSSCSMDKAVTDFPDPDSPTMATISPRLTSKEISFNALLVPSSVSKSTWRFFIWRSGLMCVCFNLWPACRRQVYGLWPAFRRQVFGSHNSSILYKTQCILYSKSINQASYSVSYLLYFTFFILHSSLSLLKPQMPNRHSIIDQLL